MKHYVVTWTIDIFGDQIECGDPTPYNAAKTAQNMLKDYGCDWIYDVKDVDSEETVRVDLDVAEMDDDFKPVDEEFVKKEYRKRLLELNEKDKQIIKDLEELVKNNRQCINEHCSDIRKRTLEIAGLDAQLRKLE